MYRAQHPELWAFGTGVQQSAILADIFDNISMMRTEYATAHSKSKPPKPKPYPTPFKKNNNIQKIGKGAIPKSEFDAWYYGENSKE